jgi:hypothetical protein
MRGSMQYADGPWRWLRVDHHRPPVSISAVTFPRLTSRPSAKNYILPHSNVAGVQIGLPTSPSGLGRVKTPSPQGPELGEAAMRAAFPV